MMNLLDYAKKGSGLLLLGKPGLSMYEDATALACELLKCSKERLGVHPDFLLIEAVEGKKSIGVDASLQILAKSALKPSVSGRIICIVDGIDKMTIPAQNKLLKLLEDSITVQVLAIAYTPQVLSTVRSRLRVVEYRPLAKKAFILKYPNISEAMYFATGGCPGLLSSLEPDSKMYQSCYDIMVSGKDTFRLLEVLNLLKEKDKLSVTKDVACMQAVCRVLAAAVMQRLRVPSISSDCVYRYTALLKLLHESETSVLKAQYTKDNFFQLIIKCIELN